MRSTGSCISSARNAVVVLLLTASVALTPAAYAHVPALEPSHDSGEAVRVAGPDASRAIYGYLSAKEGHDDYVFSVATPVRRTIGVIVPAYPEHSDFRPTVTIESTGAAPVVVKDPGKNPRETEWEPFSLTTFWRGSEKEVELRPGVDYRMPVEPGRGDRQGRYVVVFGGPEEFSVAETLATLVMLPRIWFGAYGDAPARWNPLALIPLAVLLIAVLLLTLAVRAIVRRLRGERG